MTDADDPKLGWSEELKSVLDSLSLQDEGSLKQPSVHDHEQPDWWRQLYSQDGLWDADVPLPITPAVKHLKDAFDDVHTSAGTLTTMRLCYAALHNGSDSYGDANELDDTFKFLVGMNSLATPGVFSRFKERLFLENPAARFAAFFDLYVDIVGNAACRIFAELLSIGVANPSLISGTAPAWALDMSKKFTRSNNHLIMLWVMYVCDGSKAFEDSTPDNWLAPAFVLMKPARFGQYVASKAWERLNAKRTISAILAFKQDYILGVEGKLKAVAGEAEVNMATQGVPLSAVPTIESEMPANKIRKDSGKNTPSTSKPAAKNTPSRKRHEVIYDIIQSGVEGAEYCKIMDERSVSPPLEWRAQGWPGSYVSAYDSPLPALRVRWRDKINKEKTRHKNK